MIRQLVDFADIAVHFGHMHAPFFARDLDRMSNNCHFSANRTVLYQRKAAFGKRRPARASLCPSLSNYAKLLIFNRF
jgi:hypothetical protein